MALYMMGTIKVKPAHEQEFLATVEKATPLYQKYGLKFHGDFQAVAGEAGVFVRLTSVQDFAAFDGIMQKVQEDADIQALIRERADHIYGSVLQLLQPLPGSSMQ